MSDRIKRLSESDTHQRSCGVAWTACPSQKVKLADEIYDLSRVEKNCNCLSADVRYIYRGHGGINSLIHAPGDCRLAGALY
jgi:hypothetical protein